jgi:Tfp pilus assembly protein PilV
MIAMATVPRPRADGAGFALVEAVVALALLGFSLLGTASMMIRGQAELRGTLLATHAADLAGDLAEQLRAGTAVATRDLLVTAWQQSVRDSLSTAMADGAAEGLLEAVAANGGLPASHTIRVRWWDPALRAPRRLELPIALSRGAEPH